MSIVTLVTGSEHKFSEYKLVLGEENFRRESIDLPELQFATIEEVAQEKVRSAFEILGTPVIVEDTGLSLNHLDGLPGPFIKFFEKKFPHSAGIRLLEGVEDRKATARACIAYKDAENEFIVVGELHGVISDHVHEGESFGFDSYFIPEGYTETLSEMGPEKKAEISHRKLAIKAFQEKYQKLNT